VALPVTDLLMGGNLNYLNNPNLLEIVNNGMDEMAGGTGDDNIVFEADGGTIEGGDHDNFWRHPLADPREPWNRISG
jgi:hypothetical protein